MGVPCVSYQSSAIDSEILPQQIKCKFDLARFSSLFNLGSSHTYTHAHTWKPQNTHAHTPNTHIKKKIIVVFTCPGKKCFVKYRYGIVVGQKGGTFSTPEYSLVFHSVIPFALQ